MSPNPQETTDFVTFTEEIFNERLHFLCSVTTFTSGMKPVNASLKLLLLFDSLSG